MLSLFVCLFVCPPYLLLILGILFCFLGLFWHFPDFSGLSGFFGNPKAPKQEQRPQTGTKAPKGGQRPQMGLEAPKMRLKRGHRSPHRPKISWLKASMNRVFIFSRKTSEILNSTENKEKLLTRHQRECYVNFSTENEIAIKI